MFCKGRTEVRGEIVMLKDDFTRLNNERRQSGEPDLPIHVILVRNNKAFRSQSWVAKRPLHF